MSDKRKSAQKQSNDKKKHLKCRQCEFYSYDDDYCTERDIENCSRQNNINFSKCDSYLTKSNLVYF